MTMVAAYVAKAWHALYKVSERIMGQSWLDAFIIDLFWNGNEHNFR